MNITKEDKVEITLNGRNVVKFYDTKPADVETSVYDLNERRPFENPVALVVIDNGFGYSAPYWLFTSGRLYNVYFKDFDTNCYTVKVVEKPKKYLIVYYNTEEDRVFSYLYTDTVEGIKNFFNSLECPDNEVLAAIIDPQTGNTIYSAN